MRRFLSALSLILVLLLCCACRQETISGQENFDLTDTQAGDQEKSNLVDPNPVPSDSSPNSVDAFFVIFERQKQEDELLKGVFTKENCYDVTPPQIASMSNLQIFKFSDSCASFVLMDETVYPICGYFGGYGFVNAVPCDFDGDGNLDLLVSSSWGSGLHRSILSVWNTTTKESTVIYDTSDTDRPQVDLIVTIDETGVYGVSSVKISPINNNYADLSYEVIAQVGTIEVVEGEAVFQPLTTQ